MALNLTVYEFPEVTDLQMTFSTQKTDPVLLAEAEERGFMYGHTPYNTLFSSLFFSGGALDFKKDLDQGFKNKCTRYLVSFMKTFDCPHQEKEGICAMLLSELVDIPKED